MGAASIIGSAASVAGVVGLTFLIHQGVVGYNGMVESRAIARVEAALSEQAREYEARIAENALAAQERSEGLREGFREKEQEYLAKINEMARTIDMAADPFNAGNDLHRRFYDVLCKISAGRDTDAREACGVLAAQTFVPARSPVLSITPETTGQWAELCDETGNPDFCEYAIVGFRTGPTYELLGWLVQLDTLIQTQDANYDIVVDQIQQILELPEPEITNER